MNEFIHQINENKYDLILNYYDHKVSAYPVEDADKFTHILFYDEDFIQKNFEECTHLFIDGTFKTRPSLNDCSQLLIVMGVLSGHVIKIVTSHANK